MCVCVCIVATFTRMHNTCQKKKLSKATQWYRIQYAQKRVYSMESSRADNTAKFSRCLTVYRRSDKCALTTSLLCSSLQQKTMNTWLQDDLARNNQRIIFENT